MYLRCLRFHIICVGFIDSEIFIHDFIVGKVVALVGIHELDDEEDLKICCKQLLAAKLWENSDGKPWR